MLDLSSVDLIVCLCSPLLFLGSQPLIRIPFLCLRVDMCCYRWNVGILEHTLLVMAVLFGFIYWHIGVQVRKEQKQNVSFREENTETY